jgi:hypothetical protein
VAQRRTVTSQSVFVWKLRSFTHILAVNDLFPGVICVDRSAYSRQIPKVEIRCCEAALQCECAVVIEHPRRSTHSVVEHIIPPCAEFNAAAHKPSPATSMQPPGAETCPGKGRHPHTAHTGPHTQRQEWKQPAAKCFYWKNRSLRNQMLPNKG